MPTYTVVADSNGDFIVPFSSSYTSGEKIIVTAEKDSAIKTIELFAPSDVAGGGVIQFGGSTLDFPWNIGSISLERGIGDTIGNYAFYAAANHASIFKRATGLNIIAEVKSIGSYAFFEWSTATSLNLPLSIQTIGDRAFQSWVSLASVVLPENLKTLGNYVFLSCTLLSSVRFTSTTPPTCGTSIFAGAASNLKIYVPAQSLEQYKISPRLNEYATLMIGV